MNLRRGLLLVVLSVHFAMNAGSWVETDPGKLFGGYVFLRLENDFVANTDHHYTHGTQLGYLNPEKPWETWVSNGGWSTSILQWLPDFSMQPEQQRWGITLQQGIYTPHNLRTPDLIPDDRPYAGLLTLDFQWHKRGLTRGKTPVLDVWSLGIGVVGPAAYAEEVQSWVHELNLDRRPQGWSNQLGNEPGAQFAWARSWRHSFYSGEHSGMQWLPHAGIQAGTFRSDLSLGSQLRWGWNLPDDFGLRRMNSVPSQSGGWTRGKQKRGFHFLLGVEGRAIGNHVLLDGNLFSDSHHVDKYPWLADFQVGCMFSGHRFEVGYIQTLRTREFKGQETMNSFGSLTVAFKW